MDLLKAMLDDLQSMSPEEKERQRELLNQRLREIEEEDERERLEEIEKARIVNTISEDLTPGEQMLQKLLQSNPEMTLAEARESLNTEPE